MQMQSQLHNFCGDSTAADHLCRPTMSARAESCQSHHRTTVKVALPLPHPYCHTSHRLTKPRQTSPLPSSERPQPPNQVKRADLKEPTELRLTPAELHDTLTLCSYLSMATTSLSLMKICYGSFVPNTFLLWISQHRLQESSASFLGVSVSVERCFYGPINWSRPLSKPDIWILRKVYAGLRIGRTY
ncbi:hypothetical protein F5887DRAFT_118830 [Amanita rubescens]|nr:hypothetical protein F5887DRAFT_118830 [Amanita rubescens]